MHRAMKISKPCVNLCVRHLLTNFAGISQSDALYYQNLVKAHVARGKLVRSRLLLQTAGYSTKVLPLACATEVLHGAVLLADDSCDSNSSRYNQATHVSVVGKDLCWNDATMLVSVAGQIISTSTDLPQSVRLSCLQTFSKCISQTNCGQRLDMKDRSDMAWRRGYQDFEFIAKMKTGQYSIFLPTMLALHTKYDDASIPVTNIQTMSDNLAAVYQAHNDYDDYCLQGTDLLVRKLTWISSLASELRPTQGVRNREPQAIMDVLHHCDVNQELQSYCDKRMYLARVAAEEADHFLGTDVLVQNVELISSLLETSRNGQDIGPS